MLVIGEKLTRVSGDGPALAVVGIETGSPARYVCQSSTNGFGPNTSWTPEQLRLLYGADDTEIVEKSERESWAAMSNQKVARGQRETAQREREAPELPSPEMVFAAAAKAAEKHGHRP
jgi:hypothetical protein